MQPSAWPQAAPPPFRLGVDLAAVDVQVVGKDGAPVTGLLAPGRSGVISLALG